MLFGGGQPDSVIGGVSGFVAKDEDDFLADKIARQPNIGRVSGESGAIAASTNL